MLHDPYFAAVMTTARAERLHAGIARRRRWTKTAASAPRSAATDPRSAVTAPRSAPAATATH